MRKRKARPPEFETDRLYQKLTVLCETRGNKLKVEELFSELIAPMYLEMRKELLEAQQRVRLAHEELLYPTVSSYSMDEALDDDA